VGLENENGGRSRMKIVVGCCFYTVRHSLNWQFCCQIGPEACHDIVDAFWAKIEASVQRCFNPGSNHVKIPMKK